MIIIIIIIIKSTCFLSKKKKKKKKKVNLNKNGNAIKYIHKQKDVLESLTSKSLSGSGYYFESYSSDLVALVRLRYSCRRSISYSSKLNDFSVTIPKCETVSQIDKFSPRVARILNLCLKDVFLTSLFIRH